jgi:hypothetical protein
VNRLDNQILVRYFDEEWGKFSRKDFLTTIILGSLMLPFLQYCGKEVKSLMLKITGTNHVLGHHLWAKDFPQFQKLSTQNILLWVGDFRAFGIRFFSQNNEKDYLLWKWKIIWAETLPTDRINFQNFLWEPIIYHYLIKKIRDYRLSERMQNLSGN